jgi:hypothetical protein
MAGSDVVVKPTATHWLEDQHETESSEPVVDGRVATLQCVPSVVSSA